MCEFCENSKIIDIFNDKELIQITDGIRINKDNGKPCIVCSYEDYENVICDYKEVNFCPICGRDLRSE